MGEKIISKCPNCGAMLCKIGNDSNVEVKCNKCKTKYEIKNVSGSLTIHPVFSIKTKIGKE